MGNTTHNLASKSLHELGSHGQSRWEALFLPGTLGEGGVAWSVVLLEQTGLLRFTLCFSSMGGFLLYVPLTLYEKTRGHQSVE